MIIKGCASCASSNVSVEEQKGKQRNKEIEQTLKRDKKERESILRILLLGSGDSGKSTFVKQISYLHNGMRPSELQTYTKLLRSNCLEAMQQILDSERVHIPEKLTKEKEDVLTAETLETCLDSLITLWKNPTVQEAYINRNKLSILIPSAADYYFNNAKRFGDPNYQPTLDDFLRCKRKTAGISELTVKHNEYTICLVDVGGQRSERRKWAPVFTGEVNTVIYLAALDSYDMVLDEDGHTNRLKDSLNLFGSVTDMPIFQPPSWILFLNKWDIFEQKIKDSPLNLTFPEIPDTDARDVEQSYRYIRRLFKARFKGNKKHLYCHHTCALDTGAISKIFFTIRDQLINTDLSDLLI